MVTGGPEVAEAFSRLPFDHLVFTGSTPVGRRVMAAAAANLVPVTLELGGKCPVLVSRSADLARAVDRIMIGKLNNAGQICIAPDYVCVPRELCAAFVDARAWVGAGLSRCSTESRLHVHDERAARGAHARAVRGRAEQGRARLILVGPARRGGRRHAGRVGSSGAVAGCHRRDARDARGDLRPSPAAAAVRSDRGCGRRTSMRGRNRWRFTTSARPARNAAGCLRHTVSGGVTVNDIAMHFLADELPFGGIGESGMGAYHGEHGFLRFSHARAVFHQGRFNVTGLAGLRPPYGKRAERVLNWLIRR